MCSSGIFFGGTVSFGENVFVFTLCACMYLSGVRTKLKEAQTYGALPLAATFARLGVVVPSELHALGRPNAHHSSISIFVVLSFSGNSSLCFSQLSV